jgi:predicted transcriptional regulator of viral defense system
MRVKTESQHQSARSYIESLAASGRYHFSSRQIQNALGISADAARWALTRLAKQKLVASPARGFYIIVPPEYRSLGCLPGDQFIPALMERLSLPYYAGLLSAAQYYGAAHHRPQEFQVILEKNRRAIKCGAVRVAFIARKRLAEVPTRSFNTPRGKVTVSTPEATAIDLAGYPGQTGGLDQAATTLSELAESIDPELLAKAATSAPVPWAQRLGYLLGIGNAGEKTGPLKAYVEKHARDYAPLSPGTEKPGALRCADWKLIINTDVDPEL